MSRHKFYARGAQYSGNLTQHLPILYDIYCLMLLIGCLTGIRRRDSWLGDVNLSTFPRFEFRGRCPALDALAVAGSVGEFGFNHESVMRSFNPMGDLWPLRDFRFYQ